jgi:hypothetical protein
MTAPLSGGGRGYAPDPVREKKNGKKKKKSTTIGFNRPLPGGGLGGLHRTQLAKSKKKKSRQKTFLSFFLFSKLDCLDRSRQRSARKQMMRRKAIHKL